MQAEAIMFITGVISQYKSGVMGPFWAGNHSCEDNTDIASPLMFPVNRMVVYLHLWHLTSIMITGFP